MADLKNKYNRVAKDQSQLQQFVDDVIAGKIGDGNKDNRLPDVTSADNGKILGIEDGQYKIIDAPSGEKVYVYEGQLRTGTTYTGLYTALYNQGKPIKTLQAENGIYAITLFINGPISAQYQGSANFTSIKTFTFVCIDAGSNLIYRAIGSTNSATQTASDDLSFNIVYLYYDEYEIVVKNNDQVEITKFPQLAGANLLGSLYRRQLKDHVISFTNVALSTSNTAQLTITSSDWTNLTFANANVKVSIGLTSGATIVLDRVSIQDLNIRFGGNIGRTQYYASFHKSNDTYSGEFGEVDALEINESIPSSVSEVADLDTLHYAGEWYKARMGIVRVTIMSVFPAPCNRYFTNGRFDEIINVLNNQLEQMGITDRITKYNFASFVENTNYKQFLTQVCLYLSAAALSYDYDGHKGLSFYSLNDNYIMMYPTGSLSNGNIQGSQVSIDLTNDATCEVEF